MEGGERWPQKPPVRFKKQYLRLVMDQDLAKKNCIFAVCIHSI